MRKRHAERLILGGFERAGLWLLNDARTRASWSGSVPEEAGVYVFLVEGSAAYVGSALRSLKQRLCWYNKADNGRTSQRVREAITVELLAGKLVEVLVAVPGPMKWNGLPIDPVLGLELGLIDALDPFLNTRGRRRDGKILDAGKLDT